MRAGPSPLTTVPRPPENGEQEVMAPMQWRDATAGGQHTAGLSLVLPCTEDPELLSGFRPHAGNAARNRAGRVIETKVTCGAIAGP